MPSRAKSQAGVVLKAVIVVLLLLLFFVLNSYKNPSRRSITIVATTEIAHLRLSEKVIWRFGHAILCTPENNSPTRASVNAATSENEEKPEQENTSNCFRSETERSGRLLINWPENTDLKLTRVGLGHLEIQLVGLKDDSQVSAVTASLSRGADETIEADTRILVLRKNLPELGSIDFVGEVHVGSVVAFGTQRILLDGKYEIREVFSLNKKSQIVREANLMMGDKFFLQDDNGIMQSASGFVSVLDARERGFNLLLSGSSAHNPTIKLERRGYDTTTIVPRWTERALTDSVGLGVTALLGLLLTIVAVIREAISLKGRL